MPEQPDPTRVTPHAGTPAASVGPDSDPTVSDSPRADDDAPTPPTFVPPVEPGDLGRIGPYRVVKRLGHGGMGAVYLGIDTRLNRKVALKVMLPEYAASASAKERFLREARAAAQVTHDNVVIVHEADERDGVSFIAMQLLQGYSLSEYLRKKGGLSVPQILRVARETAAGLAAAHRLGLVHRDIKPANLWLEAPNGRVKVLDFGLAKPVETQGELTKSGVVVGTPGYMSPEQARGRRVDARSDLFSLGVVLYRLCTGRMPFEGPDTMAVLMALGGEEPVPVRELNPEVPEGLAGLIHQLLAKNPDLRPQTADEVVERVRIVAEELAAPTAFPVETEPQVVYVPIQLTAHTENSVFADLDATEIDRPPVEPPGVATPVRGTPRGRGPWPAVAAVVLLAAVAVGLVGFLRDRDRPAPPPEPDTAGTAPARTPSNPDRAAAEWVLAAGGSVKVNGDERGIRAVAELPRGRFTLDEVVLIGVPGVTDESLTRLRDCKSLKKVRLDDTDVTDTGLAHLRDCKTLVGITLGRTRVGDAGLAHLRDCKELSGLILEGTRVTDAGMVHLKGKPLSHLDLLNTAVTDAGLAHLKGCESVANLFLNGSGITDTGLANFRDCKGLLTVHLSGTGLTDDGLRLLTAHKTLLYATVPDTRITDEGLKLLAGCPGLRGFKVSGTAVTDAGLAHFKGRTGLDGVDVARTRVTDAGLEHLAGCTGLLELVLSGTAVTDAGLARLKGCTRLTAVLLNDTAIGDVVLDQLRVRKNLTRLDVRKTRVTAKAVEEFHAARPRCRIEHDGGVIEGVDPDRKAAEWVLSVGGTVRVNGSDRDIKTPAELPRDGFDLTGVNLVENRKLTDAGLAHFAGCKRLKELRLAFTKVGDAGMVHFKDCKSLTHLQLDETQVTDTGLAHFKDCDLTELRLQHTEVTDAGLAQFRNCKNLTALNLRETRVTDEGLANFKDCKGLTELVLYNTAVGDAGVAHFRDCKKLVYLILNDTKVTDLGLANFTDCEGLVTLVLSGTKVTDAGLAPFKDSRALGWLEIQATQISPKLIEEFHAARPRCRIAHNGGIIQPIDVDRRAAEWAFSVGGTVQVNRVERDLKAAAELPPARFALTAVSLRDRPVTDASLANLRGCDELDSLSLHGTKVTDAGLEHLRELKRLAYLSLHGTNVTDDGLDRLRDCTRLVEIYLYGTKVTDAGLARFRGARGMTALGLGGKGVTDAGVANFKDSKGLTALYLGGTAVTDTGLENFEGCAALTTLWLDDTGVSDAGLAHFRQSKGLTNLNLNNTRVTDAGLAALGELQRLTALDVRKTQVTPKFVEEFAKTHPRCRVEHDGGVIQPKP